MNKFIFVYKPDERREKWYLTFTLSGSNFYILLSKSDMKKLSKEIKRVGF
jgi:hypothetical protein